LDREVRKILKPYKDKSEEHLLIFYAGSNQINSESALKRNELYEKLVGLAQKGNLRSLELIVENSKILIEEWLERKKNTDYKFYQKYFSFYETHPDELKSAIEECVYKYGKNPNKKILPEQMNFFSFLFGTLIKKAYSWSYKGGGAIELNEDSLGTNENGDIMLWGFKVGEK
jgi:hypothetical protein